MKDNTLSQDARIYEYTSAANPVLPPIPVSGLDSINHESGPTRVIPFDLSDKLNLDYPASSPNLLASFIRICSGENIKVSSCATSNAFYIINGGGYTEFEGIKINWSKGDLFVVPFIEGFISHYSECSDCSIYWINDEPLMKYLGVKPNERKFEPTYFSKDILLAEVERVKHEPGAEKRNRVGILLGNRITEGNTKTLTHILWSLLNILPPGDAQRPHRHNSVALDLCVSAPQGEGVYTLMGPELDENGWVKNPIKCLWKSGSIFSTPPGWWHSHHNDTNEPAWVLPMQDAGLYTHQRTLDIQFSHEKEQK